MVPKLNYKTKLCGNSFRAVLFRMVPKPLTTAKIIIISFRAVLFRMVPKLPDVPIA